MTRLLPLVLLLAACRDAPPPAPPGSDESAAYERLATADTAAVRMAYARLERLRYSAEITVTTQDDDGSPETTVRTIVHRPGDDTASESTDTLQVRDPLSYLIPDEPAYLAARTRDQYRYTVGPDTTIDGQQLRVVEASLRPEAEGKQPLRRIRYLFDDAGTVAGVAVERRSDSALFDEQTHALVLLAQSPRGSDLPSFSEVETTVDVPGTPPRRLHILTRVRTL